MAKLRVFTSFDFDHDEDLRNLLAVQSKYHDSPFEIASWSLNGTMTSDWKDEVRTRIRSVDQMIVICGEYTHNADVVSEEVRIAQEERKPYFLLTGRTNRTCTKPEAAKNFDTSYHWTWENLKHLLS